jgi:hypothetical protein
MCGAECSSPIPSHLRLNPPQFWSLYQSTMWKSSYFIFSNYAETGPRGPDVLGGWSKKNFESIFGFLMSCYIYGQTPKEIEQHCSEKNPSYSEWATTVSSLTRRSTSFPLVPRENKKNLGGCSCGELSKCLTLPYYNMQAFRNRCGHYMTHFTGAHNAYLESNRWWKLWKMGLRLF